MENIFRIYSAKEEKNSTRSETLVFISTKFERKKRKNFSHELFFFVFVFLFNRNSHANLIKIKNVYIAMNMQITALSKRKHNSRNLTRFVFNHHTPKKLKKMFNFFVMQMNNFQATKRNN